MSRAGDSSSGQWRTGSSDTDRIGSSLRCGSLLRSVPSLCLPQLPASTRNTLDDMSAPPHADHYALLGVAYDCNDAALASAFRSRSLALHPDKLGQLSPADRKRKHDEYLQLQQAYHVLRHQDTRQQYDLALQGTCGPQGVTGCCSSAAQCGLRSCSLPPSVQSLCTVRSVSWRSVCPLWIGRRCVLGHGRSVVVQRS